MLERWKALPWEKKVIFGGFAVLVFLIVLGIFESAFALDLNAAGKTRAIAGADFSATTADTIRFSPAGNDSASFRHLPTAYMVWTPLGQAFGVRRFYNGTAESVWSMVPEGQSLTIPAPPGYLISGDATHVLAFKGTVTDSVLILPLYR